MESSCVCFDGSYIIELCPIHLVLGYSIQSDFLDSDEAMQLNQNELSAERERLINYITEIAKRVFSEK